MKPTDEYDDNRTIADMSMIEKPTLAGTWFGRRFDAKRSGQNGRNSASGAGHTKNGEMSDPPMDKETRRLYIGGALRASLFLGLIYLAVFAGFIGLLLLLWHTVG